MHGKSSNTRFNPNKLCKCARGKQGRQKKSAYVIKGKILDNGYITRLAG